MNRSKKYGLEFLTLILVVFMSGCTTFLDDDIYSGKPKSLSYMQMDIYNIGDDYVSEQPAVLGGEDAIFSIAQATGPVDEDVLLNAFSISETEGNISIIEFSQLLPGSYSLDIKVENAQGSEIFTDVFQFNAVQVVPSKLKYIPSIYSFYGYEIGETTSAASVNGGGPYVFELDDPLNYFNINSSDGVIEKAVEVDVEEDDKIINSYNVTVTNELGQFIQEDAITIEIIGANVGKLNYNMEYAAANVSSLGFLNGDADTYTGSYTDIINEEEYTTNLSDVNDGYYKGSRYVNTWHVYPSKVSMDVSGGSELKENLFLSFKTASSTTEAVSIVSTDSIDLTIATSAYTELVGYKRYIDNDFNQKFVLMVCDNDGFNEDDLFDNNWVTIDGNIAPGLLSYSSAILESKLIDEGTQIFDIPSDLIGKHIRLGLKAVHLNPSLGKLGREAFIYKWQVRIK